VGTTVPGKPQLDERKPPKREGRSTVRFARTTSPLERLADALRRADATWQGDEIFEWDQLTESQREQWRAMARDAATTVFEEITVERRRGISG
jgi:hypothetical protein